MFIFNKLIDSMKIVSLQIWRLTADISRKKMTCYLAVLFPNKGYFTVS